MSFDPNEVGVYQSFKEYDFDGNKEYLAGLEAVYQQYLVFQADKDASIKKDLDEHNFDTTKIKPAYKEQLDTQAKVFFFCKQTGNILDLDDYNRWEATVASEPEMAAGAATLSKEDPPYSATYEQIVDMIVNNKQIPGIKQIPDTVLDPETASKHTLKARQKPWETASEDTGKETEKVQETPETVAEASSDTAEAAADVAEASGSSNSQ